MNASVTLPEGDESPWSSSLPRLCSRWLPCKQTAFSSQKPLYHLVFLCISSTLFKEAMEDYEFSCILSLLPKCLSRRSAVGAWLLYSAEGFFCLSLKQYEHSFCSGERSHFLNMCRSPRCVYVCVRTCVNALTCCESLCEFLQHGAVPQKIFCDDLIPFF